MTNQPDEMQQIIQRVLDHDHYLTEVKLSHLESIAKRIAQALREAGFGKSSDATR